MQRSGRPITFSIGVLTFLKPPTTVDVMVAEADALIAAAEAVIALIEDEMS